MMRKQLLAAAIAVAGLMAQPVSAAVIYTNFGPGHSYDGGGGYIEGGSAGMFGKVLEGVQFTSPFNTSLEQIDLAVGNVAGANTATVSLWTESGGLPLGMLAAWDINGIAPMGGPGLLVTVSGISGINLTAGTDYFLVLGPQDSIDDSANLWVLNSIGAVGLVPGDFGAGWDASGASGILEPAFDIIGSGGAPSVPEPASLALLVGGIAGAWRPRRHRAK